MKNIIYVLPLFVILSCGGSGSSEEDGETAMDTVFTEDHEWIVSANKLKEKLGELHRSWSEVGNKEVEETICNESSTIPYNGNTEEMNIWLMTTYMLDNFSNEEFGKNNFKMPEAKIRDETPLAELNWLNINSLDSSIFDIYNQYPDLINIPRTCEDEDGKSFSNEETVQKADMLLKAIEDGLFGVFVITDYLHPSYVNEGEYETGYVMGYILFADWETGQLSCISPLLAQNNEEIDFSNTADGLTEVIAMTADLQQQTFSVIDSIARIRTGFKNEVWVNNAAKLEKYRD